jgi:hypothetical protein
MVAESGITLRSENQRRRKHAYSDRRPLHCKKKVLLPLQPRGAPSQATPIVLRGPGSQAHPDTVKSLRGADLEARGVGQSSRDPGAGTQ